MTNTPTHTNGTILHLQRLSTEDGPGIRTTVFFKGCPLSCAWCHNPESISRQPQVQWLQNRCIGCLTCVESCPRHGLRLEPSGLVRDRTVCTVCGTCVEACPAGAMEGLGQQVQAGALLADLLKDRSYYEKSGGGVTLSGGEPTLQAGFALELAQQLAAAGISVALDTCGLSSRAALERLLPYVDTILFDVKLVDPLEHEHWTGVSNRVIFENLRWLCAELPAFSPRIRLWVRTPVIPGATDSAQNIKGIGALLAGLNGAVERWELCAFNNLCRDKYDRLGMDWDFAGTPLLTRAELEQVGRWASTSGFDPQRVFVTGAARVEG